MLWTGLSQDTLSSDSQTTMWRDHGRDLDNNIPRHPTLRLLLRSICHVNWKTFLRSGRVWTQFYFIFPTFQTPGPGLDFMMRYNGPDPSHKPDIFWL